MAHGLIVWDALGDAIEYELRASRIGLGRGERNQIRLNCEFLSSYHLEFVRCDSGYELNDLESSNGTKVNGVPCRRHFLEEGDRLLIGGRVAAHYVVVPDLGEHPALSLRERQMELALARHLILTKRINRLEERLRPEPSLARRHPEHPEATAWSFEDLLRRVEKLEASAGLANRAGDEATGEGLES